MPTETARPDPARILEWLATPAWLADRDKVLSYVNAAGRKQEDIVTAVGRSIVENCHKPESVTRINALYEKWKKGSTEPEVYSRPIESGRTKHNILIPVHGPEGFEGVLELSFTTSRTT
jgi:DUF438 domain-containing protein